LKSAQGFEASHALTHDDSASFLLILNVCRSHLREGLRDGTHLFHGGVPLGRLDTGTAQQLCGKNRENPVPGTLFEFGAPFISSHPLPSGLFVGIRKHRDPHNGRNSSASYHLPFATGKTLDESEKFP